MSDFCKTLPYGEPYLGGLAYGAAYPHDDQQALRQDSDRDVFSASGAWGSRTGIPSVPQNESAELRSLSLGGERQTRRPLPKRGRRYVAAHGASKFRKVSPMAFLIAMIATFAVGMAGWAIFCSYHELSLIASMVMPEGLAKWWPLMLYGPWVLAALSIMNNALRKRQAWRSWIIMILASMGIVALCAAHSPKSFPAIVISGIPPITALACFQELIAQISSCSHPRHATRSVKSARPEGI